MANSVYERNSKEGVCVCVQNTVYRNEYYQSHIELNITIKEGTRNYIKYNIRFHNLEPNTVTYCLTN